MEVANKRVSTEEPNTEVVGWGDRFEYTKEDDVRAVERVEESDRSD